MVVIIDYGLGNLGTILSKLKRLEIKAAISSDPQVLSDASKLILPGVGHFAQGMENLKKSGLIPVLEEKVLKQKTPILGICLGMQLLTNFSEEGNEQGLSWIKGETKKFSFPSKLNLRVPHVGWDSVKILKKDPLFEGIKNNSYFYFTHSYYVSSPEENVIGQTDYGIKFASIIKKDNIIGVQFHPEKSHKHGLKLLKNFIDYY